VSIGLATTDSPTFAGGTFGEVLVVSGAVGTTPLRVRAAASQTANLTEWQASDGSVGARVNNNRQFSNNWGDTGSEVFGDGTTSSGTVNAGFGNGAVVAGGSSAFGYRANAGTNAVTIGRDATAADNSIAIGRSAAAATGEFVAGGVSLPISQVFFGRGKARNLDSPVVINGTGGLGADDQGSKLTLAGGKSTGSAVPAVLAISTSVAASSGTALQTLRDVANFDGNTTSGETPMLLLDCTKGTLQRVSLGVEDSGGTGFKALRVPN
jgi:hypothetical protein